MNQIARLSQPLQRTAGEGRIDTKLVAGRSRLARLFQEGAAKIRLPRHMGGDLEAVLINTAGGLTGGDHLIWRASAGAGSHLTVTTQACEKLYRSSGGEAEIDIHLDVASDAHIAWLPQETIVYDGSRTGRRLNADIAGNASLLVAEAIVFGRKAKGEQVKRALFRDRWRIHQSGRLIHGEDMLLDGDVDALLARPAAAGGALAVATVLLVAPDAADRLTAIRQIIEATPEIRGGASAWTIGQSGKLLARLLASDSYDLRKGLVPLMELLSKEATMPRIWSL